MKDRTAVVELHPLWIIVKFVTGTFLIKGLVGLELSGNCAFRENNDSSSNSTSEWLFSA